MSPTNDTLTPRPEHRFTFGLWTVGNPGHDPFGGPTREPLDPVDSVKRLGELGAWGVSLHDEDLIPWGIAATPRELAALAPVVFNVASAGDVRANALVALAVEELVLHVRALSLKLCGDDRGVEGHACPRPQRPAAASER